MTVRRASGGGCARLSSGEVKTLAERVVARHFPRVDPVMLRAMVEIESGRDPCAERFEAHINDTSYGLMQTLLTTAAWLYNDMGARAMGAPTPGRLRDAEASIYFGAAMVNWLRTYRGIARSERWIVESYNGGPGASNAGTQNHWRKYQAAKQNLGG